MGINVPSDSIKKDPVSPTVNPTDSKVEKKETTSTSQETPAAEKTVQETVAKEAKKAEVPTTADASGFTAGLMALAGSIAAFVTRKND